ncbi:hypothetical protein LG315_07530 [Microbacterium marinum]|uniref:hypothetical protein n=1 Tax=Microbacterium marinum TaxID=421115 RepID=UPI003850C2B3
MRFGRSSRLGPGRRLVGHTLDDRPVVEGRTVDVTEMVTVPACSTPVASGSAILAAFAVLARRYAST